MGQSGSFLAHIAGLRAVAILAVVLFHLNGQFFSNGYLGVDVFLVISGYLLFLGRQKTPGLTTWGQTGCFLLRRIRRIFPAMLPIIILTIALGMLFFCPKDEWTICKVGYTACMAKANLTLEKIFTNYFATDAKYNPLLHLWYLSVALQVYFIYALADQALQRLSAKAGIAIICAISALSLLLCYSYPLHEWLQELGLPVWEQHSAPSYYATLPRLWEVAAGGLALALPQLPARHIWSTAATALGLLLILLPMFTGIEPATLMAVAGSILTLRYAPQSHLHRLLANKLFLRLGGISFSVYLVHMPLFVFWRMWLMGEVSAWDEALMAATAILLGWGYGWAVEKRRCSWWLLITLWVATLILCRIGRNTLGFAPYALPQAKLASPSVSAARLCRNARTCAHWEPLLKCWRSSQMSSLPAADRNKPPLLAMGDDHAPATILLIGDSHASHLYEGLDAVLKQEGRCGVYLSSIIIPFSGWREHQNDTYYYNPEKEAALLRWLHAHPEITHVIISIRWHERIKLDKSPEHARSCANLRAFLQALQAAGKHAILMGPAPEFGLSFSVMRRTLVLRDRKVSDIHISRTLQEYNEAENNRETLPILQQMEAEGLCSFLDMRSSLAEGEAFSATHGDYSLMKDDNHFSVAGSLFFMQKLKPQLLKALLNDE